MRTTLINIRSEHRGEKVKFSFIDPPVTRTRGLKKRLREYSEYEAINYSRPLPDGKDSYPILRLL